MVSKQKTASIPVLPPLLVNVLREHFTLTKVPKKTKERDMSRVRSLPQREKFPSWPDEQQSWDVKEVLAQISKNGFIGGGSPVIDDGASDYNL